MNHNKIVVALLITSMRPGGAERVMSIIANDLVKRGYEVHLFLLETSEPFYDLSSKINIHFVGLEFNSNHSRLQKIIILIKKIIVLIKKMKNKKIQVAVSFGLATNIYAIFLSAILSIPVIVSERINIELYKVNGFLSFLRKKIYGKPEVVVVQTNELIGIMKKNKIKLPKKVVVIENPIEPICQEIDFSKKQKIITIVGRFNEQKGYSYFLQAISGLLLNGWIVHIIGDGILRNQIQNQILELGLSEKVILLGRQKKVYDYLRKSSIFVLTSQYEGFPNVLCEAMINGNACVSFDCSTGPREIIKDNENGFLVPLNDVEALKNKIQYLIENDKERALMGFNATKLYKRLSKEVIMKKWCKLIDESVV